MNDSKRFSYIAAITTIVVSVIIAGGITWLNSYNSNINEGIKDSSLESEKALFVSLHSMYKPRTVQESKVSSIPSSLPSSIQSFRSAYQFGYTSIRKLAPSVTIRTQRSNITIFPQLNENETHDIFSANIGSHSAFNRIQNGISLNLRNASAPTPSQAMLPERIAYVAPTFTTAAYNHKFYVFYRLEEKVPRGTNVTKDLSLLTSKVVKLPSQIIKHAFLGPTSNVQVITDQDVDSGSIFTHKNPSSNTGSVNKYDVLILGHQEYVTQNEYDNLKHYVENGGTLLLLDGNVFYAQVSYDRHTHSITLIRGHGWAYNGQSAWRSINERWAKETSEWIGSNYLCYSCKVTFANDPWEYKHHEEQYITNRNDTILTNYDATLVTKHPVNNKPVIATYELDYKKGRVIVLGLYSDDILNNVKFDRFFDTLLLQHTFKHAIS